MFSVSVLITVEMTDRFSHLLESSVVFSVLVLIKRLFYLLYYNHYLWSNSKFFFTINYH